MTQEIEAYDARPDIFKERDPQRAIIRYTEIAQAVGSLIEKQNLYVAIGGRKHVRIEGWQALGAPMGIFAEVESSKRIQDGDRWGYEAAACAHRISGETISAADAECWSDEQNWRGKPDFQIRSMAQTRACAKALRLALGFVMAMAGYEATPAEEMVPESRRPSMGHPKRVAKKPTKDGPDYSGFWTIVRRDYKLESGTVHGLLKVASLKDWIEAGLTLNQAFVICKEYAELIKQGWNPPEAEAEMHRRHFEREEEEEAVETQP